MALRTIKIAAALVLASGQLAAQDVRIEVVEAATGKAIVGANVAVLDSAGLVLGGGFSDQGGHRSAARFARRFACAPTRSASTPGCRCS